MAEKKINRHTHPILVKARKESYFAGKTDGFKEGYTKGYGERCADLIRYYTICLKALETKSRMQQEEIRKLKELINNG